MLVAPHREAFRRDPSEDRAIKYAGAALIAYHEASIDEDALIPILREVADWLDQPSAMP